MSSDRAKLDQLIGCSVFNKFSKTSRHYNGLQDSLGLRGFYPVIEHWRGGKLFDTYQIHNDIVIQGKNLILNTLFNSTTASPVATSSWSIGLVTNTGWGAFAEGDTLPSKSWNEFTAYTVAGSGSIRPAWGQGVASGKIITNATPATFTITVSTPESLKGIFVASNNAKGATSGDLWATGSFAALVPVTAGDEMKITYTVSS